jgi:hypothetical protein
MRADKEACYYYPNYDAVKSYFDSLNREDIIFEDSPSLFEACKILVCEQFGSEDENKDLYHGNLINLYALMQAVQPWFTPAE